MRKVLVLLAVLGFFASEASASVAPWLGTATTKLGAGAPSNLTGLGVATINGSGPVLTAHLNTLRIAGGITGSNGVPVTDPEVTGTIRTIATAATIGSGTFAPISGGGPLTQNTLPVGGTAKICLILAGCPNFLALPLTTNAGNTGVGVMGTVTVGGAGPLRISLQNNPWTLGTGMAVNMTDNSAFTTKTITGFVHGPASATSSTAMASGVVQLISPIQVLTIGVPGQNEKLSLFGTLRFHFVPEPGLLLLLGSGVVGLALLGRNRLKK